MSVSHLASSESHTGTTGIQSLKPRLPGTIRPAARPRGVTVFVRTGGNAGVTLCTGVTYAGVTVPEVPGGEASRMTGSTANVKVYHLGEQRPDGQPRHRRRQPDLDDDDHVCRVRDDRPRTATRKSTKRASKKTRAPRRITERSITDGDSRSDSLRYACRQF